MSHLSIDQYLQSFFLYRLSLFTFPIVLWVPCCCSQCVEVSACLFIPVVQTHTAELWLPEQGRLWTFKKRTPLMTSVFLSSATLHES